MKRIIILTAAVSMLMVGYGLTTMAQSVEGDMTMAPKYTIADIMTKAHRRPANLLKTVASGQATDEQKAALLDLYVVLAEHKSPNGDQADWANRTALLVEAAKAAVDGNPEAGNMLTKASSCAGCHDAHK